MNKTTIYRKPMGESLFEEEFTVEALSQMGNPLERLSSLVDFEMFRPVLEDVLLTKECKTPAGRKPIDVVLMFKVVFLQRYYGFGDHQIQYQIIDRTSFRQFLGIHTVAEIPDEKTVWACRDKLGKAGTFDLLFDKFRAYLDSLGLSFNEGKIIDATFVEAPRQRNTHEENKQIKDGNGAALWQSEDRRLREEKKLKTHKRSHKDIDARWTKKRGESHYGYNAHVKADKKTKLIEKYHTTDASVHDSNVIEPLIEEKDKEQCLWLDAGYVGKEEVVEKCGMKPIICEKGYKNHPLTEEQKKSNRKKSHSRCLIEYIFGFVEGAMNGSLVRSIGMVRAKASTALTYLVYNI
ncbi:MAG: IS5 family transposase, partial [Prevotella sp.]